jgi:hypothetical protein
MSRLVLPALVVIFVARSEAVARDRELPEPPRRAKTGDRTHGRDIGVRWVVTCTATNCYRDQARLLRRLSQIATEIKPERRSALWRRLRCAPHG